MFKTEALRNFFLCALMMLTMAGCGGGGDSSSSQAPASQAPIKLGFMSSFTGPYQQNGFNGIAGVNLAVAEINASGGILGRQVIVVQGDDQSDPTAAVNDMNRLVQTEKIDALIGPISSQITLATISILNAAKIPSISVSGSSLLTPAMGPYHFSMLPGADTQAEAIANYLASVQAGSAAIIYDSGAQSASTVSALTLKLREKNIGLTGSQQYQVSATDMSSQLGALRQTNPDYLVALTGTGSDSGYILKNRQEMGWSIPVVGNITLASQAANTVNIAGPNAYNGVGALTYKELTYCPGDAVGVSYFSKFKDRLRQFDPANYASYQPLVVAYTYNAVYALKAGLEGAKRINGPDFASWMETYPGLLSALMSLALNPSDTNHFLISADALVIAARPDQTNSDGLMMRTGCRVR